MNTYCLKLADFEQPKPTENRLNEWVTYGKDNEYYTFLIDCFNNSATNNAVINNICKLVYGVGLNKQVPFISKKLLRNSIMDFKMMGQFAWQIVKSNGKIIKIAHVPIQLIAPNKCDSFGNITGYWYSDNWLKQREFKPKYFPKFQKDSNNSIEILVYGNYTVGQKYFSNVDYIGCLPYCKLEQEIGNYLINEVQNSFSPTLIVNNNSGIQDEEKQRIIAQKTKETLTGSKGAKLIMAFNSDESKKTTVENIPLNDAPEHYRYVSEEAQQKILTGHNVVSPMLFGISTSTGFSSNADEIKNASLLFESMVIKPIREIVIDAIEFVTDATGVDFISLQPIEFKKEPVQLSEYDSFQNIGHGELNPNEWELVDSFAVDYDKEQEFDLHVQELNKPTLLERIQNFVSTGVARTKSTSEQDSEKYITRYRYSGNPNPERAFCKAMMRADKLYRKEDIMSMSEQNVNPGFGMHPNPDQPYDIFLFKGGGKLSDNFNFGTCKHFWIREMYKRIGTGKNTQATPSTPAQVRKNGEIAPTNDKRGYIAPHDM